MYIYRLQVVLGVDDVHAALDVNVLDVSSAVALLLQHCLDSERM